jgi:hypothetical protein
MSSRVEELAGNAKKQLESLHRANHGIDKDFLGEENYNYNLYQMFVLELQMNKFANAQETFKLLEERPNAEKFINALSPSYSKLNNLLSSNEPLVLRLEINDRGMKTHPLYRNSFAISEVQGELDMLDIRCQNKRTKYTAKINTIWSIPQSWGKCSVMFEGDEGTSFKVVEGDSAQELTE